MTKQLSQETPRYEPTYNTYEYPEEVFVGYIEEFDMYIDWENDTAPITLVGPHNIGKNKYNFAQFEMQNGQITQELYGDISVTPYYMCLVYAKAIEHGLIKETADAAEV